MPKQRSINWLSFAKKLNYPTEKDMWAALYLDQGLALTAIAKRFGVSESTIRNSLIRCDIPLRQRGGPNRGEKLLDPTFFDYLAKNGAKATAAHFRIAETTVYDRIGALRRRLAEEEKSGAQDAGRR